jgi:hypothetical protein
MEEKGHKYKEIETLKEIEEYIIKTYAEHYVGNKGIQVMDLLLANEPTGLEYARGNVVKYVMRYGKKGGYERKDLLKAAHYLLFMLYNDSTL